MRADKIYLVGFMGSGKSSLGRALATRLGWQFLDIDEIVERAECATVSDIFTRRGEPYFRLAERRALKSVLPSRHAVVATGGGTFVDAENRLAIQQDGVTVWLDVSLKTVLARCPTDGSRPLFGSRLELERLYAARRPAYQQASLHLDAACAPIGELVERILDWIE